MFDRFSSQAARLVLEALDHDQLPFISVRSDSMAPLLGRGDEVQLGPLAAEGPAVGDIVVLGTPEGLLAHRLWDISDVDEQTYLLTRGDRLSYYDSLAPKSQLKAVVIARRRTGRLLYLNRGRGAWLNHKLTQLACFEARLMRLPLPTPAGDPGRIGEYGLGRRIARRLLFITATCLTGLVGVWSE